MANVKRKLSGKDLEKCVIDRVCEIPFGCTSTYGKIATECGKINPRVVGKILSKNQLLIAIPCHRIIHSNEKPGKYRRGSDIKIKMI